jgi:hypothetical protein
MYKVQDIAELIGAADKEIAEKKLKPSNYRACVSVSRQFSNNSI